MSLTNFARSHGKPVAIVGVSLLLLTSLSGCSGIGRALGMSKRPPDEFTVVGRAPLVVPPDYNLMPPKEGSKAEIRKNDIDPQKMAFEALFPPNRGNMPAAPAGNVSGSKLKDGEQLLSPSEVPANDDIYQDKSTDQKSPGNNS